jgi:hypothetical protein
MALVTGATGHPETSSTISATELGYINGASYLLPDTVTAHKTQINKAEDTLTVWNSRLDRILTDRTASKDTLDGGQLEYETVAGTKIADAAAGDGLLHFPDGTIGVDEYSTVAYPATIATTTDAVYSTGSVLAFEPSADTSGHGVFLGPFTVGEAMVTGQPVYIRPTSGQLRKAEADSVAWKYNCIGILIHGRSQGQTDGYVLTSGIYRNDTGYGWTKGDILYLSADPTTTLGLTTTVPTGANTGVIIIGKALTDDCIQIKISDVVIRGS